MVIRKEMFVKSPQRVDVEKLIEKGAKVKSDNVDKKKWTNINLRITTEIIDDIENILKDRVGITRTGWILEAIQEKLKAYHENKRKNT